MKRLTQEEWVVKAQVKYAERYDYSRSKYILCNVNVEIGCNTCGSWFWQRPDNHLSGYGCPSCGKNNSAANRRSSREEFVRKATELRPGDYNYSRVVYVNNTTNVNIGCNTCGSWFWQRPDNHLSGKGCGSCAQKKVADSHRSSRDEFIKNATDFRPGEFDYSRVVYIDSRKKVEIGCNACGLWFWQAACNHLVGNGCPSCKTKKIGDALRSNRDKFIEKAEALRPEKFDYSRVIYVNSRAKVEIGCKTCGKWFWQAASSHLCGTGCPICDESKGERLITSILDSLAVRYERQRKFDNCRYKARLPFDFYLPDHNICLEYHGEQHYKAVSYFGGEKKLKANQKRDRIKLRFCENNGIRLEVIPYWLPDDQVRTIVERLAHLQLTLF